MRQVPVHVSTPNSSRNEERWLMNAVVKMVFSLQLFLFRGCNWIWLIGITLWDRLEAGEQEKIEDWNRIKWNAIEVLALALLHDIDCNNLKFCIHQYIDLNMLLLLELVFVFDSNHSDEHCCRLLLSWKFFCGYCGGLCWIFDNISMPGNLQYTAIVDAASILAVVVFAGMLLPPLLVMLLLLLPMFMLPPLLPAPLPLKPSLLFFFLNGSLHRIVIFTTEHHSVVVLVLSSCHLGHCHQFFPMCAQVFPLLLCHVPPLIAAFSTTGAPTLFLLPTLLLQCRHCCFYRIHWWHGHQCCWNHRCHQHGFHCACCCC